LTLHLSPRLCECLDINCCCRSNPTLQIRCKAPAPATRAPWTFSLGTAGDRADPSKMVHLARLITSTKAQVCFVSETRNASISRTSLLNHFNVVDAHIVPAQGQSGSRMLVLI
jgi:hypothetical protein